jgi:hypothetical protein
LFFVCVVQPTNHSISVLVFVFFSPWNINILSLMLRFLKYLEV